MRLFPLTSTLIAALASFAIVACGDDGESSSPDPTAWTVDLTTSGLGMVTEGAYEGWLIYGDEKVSTGVFTDPATASFSVDRDPALADAFVVTVEPTPDADPEPSGVIALEGALSADGSATDLQFVANLDSAAGGFILRTPTDDGETYSLDLTLDGLEDLSSGVYEGWLIYGDEKVSTGRFANVADASATSDRNPLDADMFVVTLEPDVDEDPGPSSVVVLAGVPGADGEAADLAFPVDFSSAAGAFFFRTPTDDATNPDNDEAGVWFLSMASGSPAPSLELPALPEGWVYEGWAVTQGVPLTTGRFTEATGADQASPYSDGGPPFPGEDFLFDLPESITGPVDLTDGASTIVISVEPDIDGIDPTGDGPFAIKPLALAVPMNHPTSMLTDLGPGPVVTVSGTLTVTVTPLPANDEAGVWFVNPGQGASLDLPTLPAGWVYEGWVVTQGVVLSTGRFADPAMADDASPFSMGGPPFPGEDFLMNLPAEITEPVNLADGSSTIVISVEPDIEGVDPTGDGPYEIKPLALDIPADHPTATLTDLGEGPSLEPTGSVSFEAVR